MTITYTPAQARQILERGLNAQHIIRNGPLGRSDDVAAINDALDLLQGILDGNVVVRETPPAEPNILTLEFPVTSPIISAGRYHRG